MLIDKLLYVIRFPYIVASHLKILIPVGTAMIIVADVKYARVSTSIPIVNVWCAHSTNPNNPFAIMAKIKTNVYKTVQNNATFSIFSFRNID